MKLPISCMKCTEGITDPSEFEKFIKFVPVNDSGVYELECPKGHKNALLLQQLQHEILFEIGVQALFDGYYREAIASFSSSLERFYELFIKVTARIYEIEDDIERLSWKLIAAQSERQLGAYIYCYLLLNKKSLQY
jgi:hypothetical protein